MTDEHRGERAPVPEVLAGLDEVLITDALTTRPARPPDYAAEAQALSELARELAASPGTVLQRLVDLIVEMKLAGSAGISILIPDEATKSFQWQAVAGLWAEHLGGLMPFDGSPCGIVVTRDTPLLFARPHAHFPAAKVEPLIHEILLVPFHAHDEPVGTLWVSAHDAGRAFDGEDLRLLTRLTGFASAAHVVNGALKEAQTARADLEQRVADRTKALRESEEHQAFLLRLSDMLRPLKTPADIAEAAARQLGEHLDLDRACYGEMRAGRLWIERDHARGVSSAVGDYPLNAFDQDFVAAYRVGAVVTVCDVETDGRLGAAAKAELRSRSIAAFADVVLLGDNERTSILCAQHATPRLWTDAEQGLLRSAGERVRSAIERARTEAALRESEERFRAFVTASSDVVYRMGPGWTEMRRLDGRAFLSDTDEASETWLDRYIHPDEQASVHSAIDRAIAAKAIFELEHGMIRMDGSLGWTSSRAVPIFDDTGEIREWLGAASDVTARKMTERALRDSEARLSQFGEASSDVLWMRDAATFQWVYLTPAFETIYGLDRTAALSGDNMLGWVELIVPEDRERAVENLRRVGAGERVTFEYRVRRSTDGEVRWLRDTDFPMRDATGTVRWIGGVGRDITEEKETAAHMSVLVSELQHRTRNLMGVVRAMADKTLRRSADLPDFKARYGTRLASLARVQGLLSRLAEGERVTFDDLIHSEVAALDGDAGKVTLEGPHGVALRSSTLQSFALAVHELATNAAKYGAFRQPQARLEIRWYVDYPEPERGPWLHVDWRERDVRMPARAGAEESGSGRELIERALPYQLGAKTTYVMEADGIHCTIALPVSGRTISGRRADA